MILGIAVVEGKIKPGYVMMDETGRIIGRIKGIQHENEPLKEAVKGMQVAISMEEPVFGKDVFSDTPLYSYIPTNKVSELLERFGDELTEDEKDLARKIANIIRKARMKT